MAHHNFLGQQNNFQYAGVAELADAPDLGSGAARRGGSSPFTRTILFDSNITYYICGSSSVVEHHLAKVGVAGSNPVFRSNYFKPGWRNWQTHRT